VLGLDAQRGDIAQVKLTGGHGAPAPASSPSVPRRSRRVRRPPRR
jgi:hypothetical protein